MNQGRIEQVGTPAEVYAKPASIFVATFIGTPPMNVLPVGWIEGEGDGIRIGVRPEHVELTTEGDGDLDGSVTLVEHLGHEVLVHVAVDGHPIACRVDPASATQRLPGRDDRVGLSVPLAHRHRFNAADEQSIEVSPP